MVRESEFNITPDLMIDLTSGIRSKFAPDVELGRGEMRNLVFENLVSRFGLPWKETPVGQLPDFSNPQVKQLQQELRDYYNNESGVEDINNVLAKCTAPLNGGCKWRGTGSARIELPDRALVSSPITDACKRHHDNFHGLHNNFLLFRGGARIGVASVSSSVCGGWIGEVK